MCHECNQIATEMETLVMLAEAERLVIDAEAAAGQNIAGAVRPLAPHEIDAKMRFGDIDGLTQGAVDEATTVLSGLRDVIAGAVLAEMVGDAETVTPADATRALAQLNAAQPAHVQEAVAKSAGALQSILTNVAAAAGQIVHGEATRQGTKVEGWTPPAVDPETFKLPAAAAALHPWQRITGKLQTTVTAPANLFRDSIPKAELVKELDSIPLAGSIDVARQTIHSAHGVGRTAAAADLNPVRIYASEIMDGNTCGPCAKIDMHKYATMDDALLDYPNGGYGGCDGDLRCRGTLVFLYDDPKPNTDDPNPEPLPPLKPKPDDAPPEPPKPHVEAIKRIKADMPADMSKVGYRDETPTFDVAMAEAKHDIEYRAGGNLEDLKAKHAVVKEKLDDWDALNRFVWAGVPSKWPDAAKPLVKKLGFGRQGPKAVAKLLQEGRYDLWVMESDASSAVAQMERALADLPDYVRQYKMKRRTVDDLTPKGKLGDETAKALDNVLEAGKTLDEELQTRLATRLATLGDKAAMADQLQSINGQRRKLTVDRATTFDDAEFDAMTKELDKLEKESKALSMKLSVYKDQAALAFREEARTLLAEIRGVGGGKRSKYVGIEGFTQETARALETAHGFYPDDWNDKLAAHRPKVEVGENQRGYNAGGGAKIMLSRDPNHNGTGELGHVTIHELGHSMEDAIPGLQAMEWAYHHRRSAKVVKNGVETLEPAYNIYGKDIGMGAEMAHTDEWALTYTGKTYRRGDMAGASTPWEIFTTGVESLFEGSPYFDRGDTLGDDAEFRRFILGVLSVL